MSSRPSKRERRRDQTSVRSVRFSLLDAGRAPFFRRPQGPGGVLQRSSVSTEDAAASAGINRSDGRLNGRTFEIRRFFRRKASFPPFRVGSVSTFPAKRRRILAARGRQKNERGKTFFSSFDAIFATFSFAQFVLERRNRRVSRRKIPFKGGATVRFRSAFVGRKAKPVAVRPRLSLPRKRAISFPARRVKGGK